MMARLVVALTCLLSALSIAGAVRLDIGEERAISTLKRTLPPASGPMSVMATDGESVLAVHPRDRAIFATRFDRDGKLLTPEPIPVLVRTETVGTWSMDSSIRLLWFRDHYVLFYQANDASLRATRITREGVPLETVTLPLKNPSPFDVATDGNEIVIVSTDPSLLRIGEALTPLGTIPLAPSQFTWSSPVRGVAYGDGRFVVLAFDNQRAFTQVVENGTVKPPIELGPARRESGARANVVWTGSTFVAGWGECTRDNYYAHCLGVWTPLTDTGAAAGPLRITGYATLYNYDTADFRLGLTALDRDSVLFTWLGADDNTVLGREYLVTGAAAGPTADFGKGPITTLMTRDGALAVMDERQRLAWVDNAVGAGLPDTLEFAPTVLAPPNEVIYGVAESETEIAVLRANGAGSSPSVGVSVLSRDGSLLRELDLGVELVGNGAIASDGRDFFAVTYHWWSGLTFHNLTTKKSTTLTSTGAYPSMVWTGRELIVVSLRESKVVVMRLDRDGRQLGTPSTLTPAHALIDLAIHNGRVLVTYHAERTTYVQVLDEHGQLVGPPEEVLDTNPWWYGAAATNGDTDVLVTMKADLSDMLVSFRPRNGTFVTPPGRVTAARSRTANYATIVPTTHGFLLAYQTSAPVLRSTNLALIDSQGFPVRELKVHIGSVGRNMLVPISPTELLLVYSRVVDDSSRAGAWRGYVRRITLVHEDGARNEPSSNRLRR